MKMKSRVVERRLEQLVKRLRSGQLDDLERFEDGELPASRLVDPQSVGRMELYERPHLVTEVAHLRFPGAVARAAGHGRDAAGS